jgi:hypothetical protein
LQPPGAALDPDHEHHPVSKRASVTGGARNGIRADDDAGAAELSGLEKVLG